MASESPRMRNVAAGVPKTPSRGSFSSSSTTSSPQLARRSTLVDYSSSSDESSSSSDGEASTTPMQSPRAQVLAASSGANNTVAVPSPASSSSAGGAILASPPGTPRGKSQLATSSTPKQQEHKHHSSHHHHHHHHDEKKPSTPRKSPAPISTTAVTADDAGAQQPAPLATPKTILVQSSPETGTEPAPQAAAADGTSSSSSSVPAIVLTPSVADDQAMRDLITVHYETPRACRVARATSVSYTIPPEMKAKTPTPPPATPSAELSTSATADDQPKSPKKREEGPLLDGKPLTEQFSKNRRVANRRIWRLNAVIPIMYALILAAVLVVLCCFYFGVLWSPNTRLTSLKIGILVNDKGYGPLPNLGQFVASKVLNTTYFTWEVLNPNTTTRQDLDDMVQNNELWSALYFPANYTAVWAGSYFNTVNTTAEYVNNALYINNYAKGYTTAMIADKTVSAIFYEVNKGLMGAIYAGKFGPKGNFSLIGSRVSPVAVLTVHQFLMEKYGWYFASYIAPLSMWVAMMMTLNMIHVSFHRKMNDLVTFKFWQVVLLRLGNIFWITMLLSIVLTGMLDGYGFPLKMGYGVTFLLFWLVGLAFSGLICFFFSLLSDIGLVFVVIVMVFQVATCDGVYNRASYPEGFKALAPVFPMYHAVEALRHVAFKVTLEPIGEAIGVLFAYAVAGLGCAIFGWAFEIGEKAMRRFLPMDIEGFYYASKTM